jgi:hypothetical protein
MTNHAALHRIATKPRFRDFEIRVLEPRHRITVYCTTSISIPSVEALVVLDIF